MKERLPKFQPVKIKSQFLWPGELVFRWIPEEPIHVFVILSPSLKGYDEFTVDIGWSLLGRFPEVGARGAAVSVPDRSEFGNDEFACRLASVCADMDEFWKLYDEHLLMDDPVALLLHQAQPITQTQAEDLVVPLAQDAIDKLVECGVPYLEDFVRFHNGSA